MGDYKALRARRSVLPLFYATAVWQLQPKVIQTVVQQHVSCMNISGYVGHVIIFSWLLTSYKYRVQTQMSRWQFPTFHDPTRDTRPAGAIVAPFLVTTYSYLNYYYIMLCYIRILRQKVRFESWQPTTSIYLCFQRKAAGWLCNKKGHDTALCWISTVPKRQKLATLFQNRVVLLVDTLCFVICPAEVKLLGSSIVHCWRGHRALALWS